MPTTGLLQSLMNHTVLFVLSTPIGLIATRVIWVSIERHRREKITIKRLPQYYWLFTIYAPLGVGAELSKNIHAKAFNVLMILVILLYSGFAAGLSIVDILISIQAHRLLNKYADSAIKRRNVLEHLLNQPGISFAGLSAVYVAIIATIFATLPRHHVDGISYLYSSAVILLVALIGTQVGAQYANHRRRADWIEEHTNLIVEPPPNADDTMTIKVSPTNPTPLKYLAWAGIIGLAALLSRDKNTDH